MSNRPRRTNRARRQRGNRNGKEEKREAKVIKKLFTKNLQLGAPKRINHNKRMRAKGKMGVTGRSIMSGMNHGIGATLREDPSTKAWPQVYMNPFLKIDARLPVWPVRQSLCQYRFASGYGHTNANGVGWISVNPINLICNDLDVALISSTTTGDAVGTGTGATSSPGTGAYTSDSFFTQGFAVRIVAFGIKIRYTGTELNRGGYMTFWQAMPRDTTNGETSQLIQTKRIDWKQYNFNDDFHQYNRLYTENDDNLYSSWDNTTNPDAPWHYTDFEASNPENYNYMVCCMNAAVAGQPFEWHLAGHFEIIGPVNNTAGVTVGTLNTTKHEKTVNTAAKLRAVDTSTPDHTGENGINWGALALEMGVAAMF